MISHPELSGEQTRWTGQTTSRRDKQLRDAALTDRRLWRSPGAEADHPVAEEITQAQGSSLNHKARSPHKELAQPPETDRTLVRLIKSHVKAETSEWLSRLIAPNRRLQPKNRSRRRPHGRNFALRRFTADTVVWRRLILASPATGALFRRQVGRM
jgi:hypothetical protein